MNISKLKEDVVNGNRLALSKAITLCESNLPSHQSLKLDLLEQILPHTGKSMRIGISGVPGAGKSTLIEVLGSVLIETHRKKVAVLAIDPSSQQSRGSILGDKTRMEKLSRFENAFIRPSPSSSMLGGVGQFTQEAILLCEAAGYDVVFIETVGVGQSEIAVSQLSDIVVLLQLVGAGDDLQAIKRGVLEVADVVVIHKSDDHQEHHTKKEAATLQKTLGLFPNKNEGLNQKVLTASSFTGEGLDILWNEITTRFSHLKKTDRLTHLRQKQMTDWFDVLQQKTVHQFIATHPHVQSIIKESQLAFHQNITQPASVIESMRNALNLLLK